jgi:hypothetical protein
VDEEVHPPQIPGSGQIIAEVTTSNTEVPVPPPTDTSHIPEPGTLPLIVLIGVPFLYLARRWAPKDSDS